MSSVRRNLDDVMTTTHRDAADYHGDLGVSLITWQTRIADIVGKCLTDPGEGSSAAFVERLHTRDLYLATGCAERHETAWQRFETLYQRHIDDLVRCLAGNMLHAVDVGEGLLVDLFLPDTSGRSRIASYDGRSSLATWLHVIVSHRVTNERVRKWNAVERPGDIPEIADHTAPHDIETRLSVERYGPAIEDSLRRACLGLDRGEMLMLTWRYRRGLLLEDIARLLAVHPSTVCRRLERLQERLRRTVIDTLTGTYGYPEDAAGECLNDVLESGPRYVALLRVLRDSLPAEGERACGDPRRVDVA